MIRHVLKRWRGPSSRTVYSIALTPRPAGANATEVGWTLVAVTLASRDAITAESADTDGHAPLPRLPWSDQLRDADGLVVIEFFSVGDGVRGSPDAPDPLEWSTDEALEALGDPRREANERRNLDKPWGRLDKPWGRLDEATPELRVAIRELRRPVPLHAWTSSTLGRMHKDVRVAEIAMFLIDAGHKTESEPEDVRLFSPSDDPRTAIAQWDQLSGTLHFVDLAA